LNRAGAGWNWLARGAGVNVAIVVFNLLLIVALWEALHAQLASEREDAVRAAINRNDNLAVAFEQYTIRTIESADAVIRHMAHEYNRRRNTFDFDKFVADHPVDKKVLGGLALADEYGNAITSSYAKQVAQQVNLADRQHFRVHLVADSQNLYLGAPVEGRIFGRTVIPLTRRVNKTDGSFGGVAIAVIEPNRIIDFLQDAKLRQGDFVSLVRRDGITLARLNGTTASAGQDIGKSPLFAEQLQRPIGSYFGNGQLDGVARYFSYRTLADYPVIVTVGSAEADVLAEFYDRRMRYLWAAGLVSVVISGFATLLILWLASQRQAAAMVARSRARFNATFEQAAVGIAHVGLDGRYLDVNQKLCNILGYSKAELLNRTTLQVTHPDDRAASRLVHERLRSGLDIGDLSRREKRYIRKDGSFVWCDRTSTPVRDETGGADYLAVVVQDISERKLAEARERSERLFVDAMVESMPGILYFYDENLKFLRWNRNFLKVTGYREEDIAAMSPLDFFLGDGRRRVERAIRLVFEGGEASVEAEIVAKDGTATPYFFTGRKLFFDGKICLVGVGIDISERRRIENERRVRSYEQRQLARRLQRERERLLEAQAVARIGSWETDIASGKVIWSEETYRIFGAAATFQPTHQSFLQLVHPDDRARVDAAFVASIGGRETCSTEHRIVLPDGKVRMVEERWRVFHDGEERALRAVGTCHDITERKDVEAALQESEMRFRRSFEDATVAMALVDTAGHFMQVNKAMCRMLGYGAAELATMTFHAISAPGDLDEDLRHFERAVAGEIGHYALEKRYLCKDGTEKWGVLTTSLLRDSSGAPLYFIMQIQDITERKLAEQALGDYTQRLRAMSRQLFKVQENERRLLARELHDTVGQELTAMGLNLARIRQALPDGVAAEVGSYLADTQRLLEDTTRHLRSTMDDLRPPGIEELGLFAVLAEHARQVAVRSDLKLILRGGEPQPRLPLETSIAVFRIAQEALNNTVKHARATDILVELLEKCGRVEVVIADNGRAFDPADAHHSLKRLGMTTMRERAEAINATLSILSQVGAGTRIVIEIPRNPAESGQQQPETEEATS
jgi:PAS domain S-box-containing protein